MESCQEFEAKSEHVTPVIIELKKGSLDQNGSLEPEANANANGHPKKKSHARTGSDFWAQVAQQTSYIDATQSSLHVEPSQPHCEQKAPREGYVCSCSTPSLAVPSQRSSFLHHRYSVRDTKKHAKITRFYSHDHTILGRDSELRVIPTHPSTSCDSRTSLAEIWAVVEGDNQKLTRKPTGRKPSSWEESVSLQRRRSLAARGTQTERGNVLEIPLPISSFAVLDTRDLRYCFQHPYLRYFTALLVIFCNFLLFAEDPISHSYTEAAIPLIGNVFSFVCTKYPPDWRWSLVKVFLWIVAILCGLIIGKLFIHNMLFGKFFRLKMFRDEQGSWVAMFLTVFLSLYLFSFLYNYVIQMVYNKLNFYMIDSRLGMSNAGVMKMAACGTWVGDMLTLLTITDVMLQDSLYPEWSPAIRRIWRRTNIPRILIFWVGSALCTALIITLIFFDIISWDNLNRDFVASTELSRAFLASLILVLDLVILMQDWDFPHFTTTVHINLPGFSVSTLKWKFAEVSLTGKWFNYGFIFFVMLLDLNMWKNQIFYHPSEFGQYVGPQNKIHTVLDPILLHAGNMSLWTYEERSKINETTKRPFSESDMQMNTRYMAYPLYLKCTAFIPSILTLSLFLWIIYLYGRFPHKINRESSENEEAEIQSEEGVTV